MPTKPAVLVTGATYADRFARREPVTIPHLHVAGQWTPFKRRDRR